MSNQAPDGPYVFQFYGSITHPEKAKAGRLWGVAGVSPHATVTGLTQAEAARVREALLSVGRSCETCSEGGHCSIFGEAEYASGYTIGPADFFCAAHKESR